MRDFVKRYYKFYAFLKTSVALLFIFKEIKKWSQALHHIYFKLPELSE